MRIDIEHLVDEWDACTVGIRSPETATGAVFNRAAQECSHCDQALDPTQAMRLRCLVCHMPFCSDACLRAHERRVAQDLLPEVLP